MQLDARNLFVYVNLDKKVFMHMLPRYDKNGKVLYLNEVRYGLQRSLLLRQQKLTNELKKLNLKKISQKLYIVQKMTLSIFFI